MPTGQSFQARIEAMNRMYELPVNYKPALPADVFKRLTDFEDILSKEVSEVDDIPVTGDPLEIFVAVADWLGDLTVYIRSEALRWGIPLEAVLDIIMDSNESKLGEDGKPIKDERDKFMKGPNYWKPEPKIRALLEKILAA
jgi:hypothetical protein